MKKQGMLFLCLLLCVVLLCSCQNKEEQKRFNVVTNRDQMISNTQVPMSMPDTPEPTSEPLQVLDDGTGTDTMDWIENDAEAANASLSLEPTPAPTMSSIYAGATPVVIDPIDKPTPTPLPALTFNYQVYDATNVHLSFQAPMGWIINESAPDTYMITNPSSGVDYAASLTIRVISVESEYNLDKVKAEVNSMMSTLRTAFSSFDGSNTAERTLLDKNGIYANYTATMADGTEVAGRVHAACINKTLYMLHVSYPKGYTETYKDALYDTFRHSVKITQ